MWRLWIQKQCLLRNELTHHVVTCSIYCEKCRYDFSFTGNLRRHLKIVFMARKSYILVMFQSFIGLSN